MFAIIETPYIIPNLSFLSFATTFFMLFMKIFILVNLKLGIGDSRISIFFSIRMESYALSNFLKGKFAHILSMMKRFLAFLSMEIFP